MTAGRLWERFYGRLTGRVTSNSRTVPPEGTESPSSRCPACGEDHNRRLQGRCAVCNGPFMYWPNREEVSLDEWGNFRHVTCPMSAPEEAS
jgi:hypothetical protein